MNATHAYVAFRPCGHPVALMVDDPEDKKETARFVAQAIRDGHRIERVTIERAREIGCVYCKCTPTKEYALSRSNAMRRHSRGRRL